MRIFTILLLLVPFNVFAESQCFEKKEIDKSINQMVSLKCPVAEPKTVVKWKTKYVPHIVYKDRVVEKNDRRVPILQRKIKLLEAQLQKEKQKVKKLHDVALEEHKKVKKLKRVKRKKIVRTKLVKEKAPRNSVDFLLGSSKTKLRREDINGITRVNREREADMGIHFSHRLPSNLNLGVAGSVNENVYFTIGLDF